MAQLTDIVGSRNVTLQAAMTINGVHSTKRITVAFGHGPLSVFRGPPLGRMIWTAAGSLCGVAGNPAISGPQPGTNLPSPAQLQAVAGPGNGGHNGAAHVAAWPSDGYGGNQYYYWTHLVANSPWIRGVRLKDGTSDGSEDYGDWDDYIVAVCVFPAP